MNPVVFIVAVVSFAFGMIFGGLRILLSKNAGDLVYMENESKTNLQFVFDMEPEDIKKHSILTVRVKVVTPQNQQPL